MIPVLKRDTVTNYANMPNSLQQKASWFSLYLCLYGWHFLNMCSKFLWQYAHLH